MLEWNVVVTVQEEHFGEACRLLESLGSLTKTNFFKVLTLQVDDTQCFLEQPHRLHQDNPALTQCLHRVLPVSAVFVFQNQAEFEAKQKTVIMFLALIAEEQELPLNVSETHGNHPT